MLRAEMKGSEMHTDGCWQFSSPLKAMCSSWTPFYCLVLWPLARPLIWNWFSLSLSLDGTFDHNAKNKGYFCIMLKRCTPVTSGFIQVNRLFSCYSLIVFDCFCLFLVWYLCVSCFLMSMLMSVKWCHIRDWALCFRFTWALFPPQALTHVTSFEVTSLCASLCGSVCKNCKRLSDLGI